MMPDDDNPVSNIAEESGKFRYLEGFPGLIQKILLALIPIIAVLHALDLPMYFGRVFFKEQYLGIFLGLILASIFLGVPVTRGTYRIRLPWYDCLLAVTSLFIALFIAVVYPDYVVIGTSSIRVDYLIAGMSAILLVLEATRRLTGWILLGLVSVFVFYARFTYLFPRPFYGEGIPWDQILVYVFLDNNALLGIPLWVSASIVFAFIFLGQFFLTIGANQIFDDFAVAIFGKFRGGPAKVAAVASGLFGTVSGSAVSNVVIDGWLTIPMMKRIGFRPHVAGAIEAVASTGGQIMPPVMGVTAFVIAEFLAIPYSQVALGAAIPALLYYIAFFIQIDLEAAKFGLSGVTEDIPRLSTTLKKSLILAVPLAVLIYTLLILNWEASKAAFTAIVAAYVLASLKKETRIGAQKLWNILITTGQSMLMIGAITGIAGIIMGLIYLTGFGSIVSIILIQIAGKSLFLMLVAAAITSTVLGMGLPTVACYIILAVLIGPAIVQGGVAPLSAHLFIFYFGMMSMITPPVCFAIYAAATIAKTNIMETGVSGVRLGIAAYIVPFLFVYSPELLLKGTALGILLVGVKTLVGISVLAVSLSGFLFKKINVIKRILIALGAIAILVPPGTEIPFNCYFLNIGGLMLCSCILLFEIIKRPRRECLVC